MNVAVCEHVKRPSNGKLKLATPVGKLRKFDKLVPLDVKLVSNNKKKNCNMAAFLVRWQSRTTVKQRKKREDIESGGEKERLVPNPVCPRTPPFCFVCF